MENNIFVKENKKTACNSKALLIVPAKPLQIRNGNILPFSKSLVATNLYTFHSV